MRIRNFAHEGLKRLYTDDIAKGVPSAAADKLRKQLAFLDAMQSIEELRALPLWGTHVLTSDRAGTWSLTVTRNYRLTFQLDAKEPAIYDIDFEDYHGG